MTRKEIDRESEARAALVKKLEKATFDSITTLSEKLYRLIKKDFLKLLDIDENGQIARTENNTLLMQRLVKMVKNFDVSAVGKLIADGAILQVKQGDRYFRLFKLEAERYTDLAKVAEKKLNEHIGYNPKSKTFKGGLRKALKINAGNVANFRGIVARRIRRGVGLSELTKLIEEVVVADGVTMRNLKTAIYDTYSQNDAIVAKTMADEIGLRHYIYNGGTVDRSRSFCRERNRRPFTEAEIYSWENMKWQGKPKTDYNPFIHKGGYRCRHRLDPISPELYEILTNKVP